MEGSKFVHQIPRSNLFQRMESQVKRITKKLSAVKQAYSKKIVKFERKQSTPLNLHMKGFQNQSTTRINQSPIDTTLDKRQVHIKQDLDNKTTPIRVKICKVPCQTARNSLDHRRPLIESNQDTWRNTLICRLTQQNKSLGEQIFQLQNICSERSYQVGYMRAFLKDQQKQLQMQKSQLDKENTQCVHLLGHYKNKATAYKKRLGRLSPVSSDINVSDLRQ